MKTYKDEFEELIKGDPYKSLPLFLKMTSDFKYDEKVEQNALFYQDMFENGELINVNPKLDNVLFDTDIPKDSLMDIKLPFNIMYINRFFKYEDCCIWGCLCGKVLDHWVVTFTLTTSRPEGFFSSFLTFDNKDTRHFYDKEFWKSKMKFDYTENHVKCIEMAMRYTINLIYFLTNSQKDVKFISRKPSKRKMEPNSKTFDPYARPTTYVDIKGELKLYVDDYNKTRNKVDFKRAFIVRGHWRTYRNDRYVNKQGESVWIAPYIKGENKEVLHRIIKVR